MGTNSLAITRPTLTTPPNPAGSLWGLISLVLLKTPESLDKCYLVPRLAFVSQPNYSKSQLSLLRP